MCPSRGLSGAMGGAAYPRDRVNLAGSPPRFVKNRKVWMVPTLTTAGGRAAAQDFDSLDCGAGLSMLTAVDPLLSTVSRGNAVSRGYGCAIMWCHRLRWATIARLGQLIGCACGSGCVAFPISLAKRSPRGPPRSGLQESSSGAARGRPNPTNERRFAVGRAARNWTNLYVGVNHNVM